MKRMSKAEEALNRQIKNISIRIENYYREKNNIEQHIHEAEQIKNQLQNEIDRLHRAREKASANATR